MAKATSKPGKSASPQIVVRDRSVWRPAMFQKQLDVFNARERHILVDGPSLSGKSIAVDHKIIRHAWETRGARVGVFSRSIRSAKIGVWPDLTGPIMREWLDAKLTSPHATFDWAKEPWTDGATRMQYFRIRNYWGEESEIQLHSLDFDDDVEAKLLEARFSCIYFSELQKFHKRKIFDISVRRLRLAGLEYGKHLWLADTNPPDEGKDAFCYQIWYLEASQEELPETLAKELTMADFRAYQQSFGLYHFELDDNIFLDERQKRDLKLAYANDPEGWDRFVCGKYTRSSTSKSKHFFGIFKPELHVAGNCDAANRSDWQLLLPTKSCTVLVGGWDIGELNHAFSIDEPIINENGELGFLCLDEIVWIGVHQPLADFIFECLEVIEAIEKLVKERTGRAPAWRHWSDTSAFRYSGKMEANFDAKLVNRLTEGKVYLEAATRAKQKYSIRHRIKMEQDLLRQDRVLISANCRHTIEMYNELRSGKIDAEGRGEVIVKGDSNKHIFDARSYAHFCELFAEAQEPASGPEVGPRLVSVQL